MAHETQICHSTVSISFCLSPCRYTAVSMGKFDIDFDFDGLVQDWSISNA